MDSSSVPNPDGPSAPREPASHQSSTSLSCESIPLPVIAQAPAPLSCLAKPKRGTNWALPGICPCAAKHHGRETPSLADCSPHGSPHRPFTLLVFLLPSLALGLLSCLPRQSCTFCLRLQHLPPASHSQLLIRKTEASKRAQLGALHPWDLAFSHVIRTLCPCSRRTLLCHLSHPIACWELQPYFSCNIGFPINMQTVISTVSKSPPAVSPPLHRRGSCPASRPPPLCLYPWTLLSVLRSNQPAAVGIQVDHYDFLETPHHLVPRPPHTRPPH